MTYASSTLGSTATNPPIELVSVLSGSNASGLGMAGRATWFYTSTHTAVEVVAANFISDAKTLGMTAGDLMFGVTASAASTTPIGWMGVIVSVSTSGANLSSNVLTSTAV